MPFYWVLCGNGLKRRVFRYPRCRTWRSAIRAASSVVVGSRQGMIDQNLDAGVDDAEVHVRFEPDVGVVEVAALRLDRDPFARQPGIRGHCLPDHPRCALDLGLFGRTGGPLPCRKACLPRLIEALLREERLTKGA